jgi:TatD DNase family protein
MPLYDVHAHLTHDRLLPDVAGILARAASAGVTTIVSNGLNPEDNAAVLKLARRHRAIKPALGLYPVDAVLASMRKAGEDYPDQRETWSIDTAVRWVEEHVDQAIALGEIGLDGYWVKEAFWPEQELAFRRLLELAIQTDKPVIIHTRKRELRALEVLEELGPRRVCWHCFGGKVNLARDIAERGHYFSIPANARRSEAFTRMLQTLPRRQILLETDCPYLGPDKSRLNEPSNVRHTAAYAAELWHLGADETEKQLEENFVRFFGVAP